MKKYIANTNTRVSSLVGTFNLYEGNEYPEFLFERFPQYFKVMIIEDPVPVVDEEEPTIVEEKVVTSFRKK